MQTLYGVWKNKGRIAAGLDADILFFDEATSSLDNETEAAVMESISAIGSQKTMIIVAHRLTTLKNCDKVYKVEDGAIVETELSL